MRYILDRQCNGGFVTTNEMFSNVPLNQGGNYPKSGGDANTSPIMYMYNPTQDGRFTELARRDVVSEHRLSFQQVGSAYSWSVSEEQEIGSFTLDEKFMVEYLDDVVGSGSGVISQRESLNMLRVGS